MSDSSGRGLYVLRRDLEGKYIWNLLSGHGATILTSESFATKGKALAAIDACRAQSPLQDNYRMEHDKGGSPYFALIGPDGVILGRSDAFPSVSHIATAILAARAYGLGAVLEDRT